MGSCCADFADAQFPNSERQRASLFTPLQFKGIDPFVSNRPMSRLRRDPAATTELSHFWFSPSSAISRLRCSEMAFMLCRMVSPFPSGSKAGAPRKNRDFLEGIMPTGRGLDTKLLGVFGWKCGMLPPPNANKKIIATRWGR
ncbi:hypothetical protein LSM04_002183 [Trypanosoma melophagium]|uniref:uncharacterized protein n=1 Tax=Trypanosoma melophagium TaxID=715481 RepID=UPI00351A7D13|nr:hypothetical protein LSM04_002183 [Trypanosoma melophagium]